MLQAIILLDSSFFTLHSSFKQRFIMFIACHFLQRRSMPLKKMTGVYLGLFKKIISHRFIFKNLPDNNPLCLSDDPSFEYSSNDLYNLYNFRQSLGYIKSFELSARAECRGKALQAIVYYFPCRGLRYACPRLPTSASRCVLPSRQGLLKQHFIFCGKV